MDDVIKFETELARIMTPLEDRRDKEKLYNLMSLKELQRKAPFVSIFNCISAFHLYSYHNFVAQLAFQ